MSSDLIKIGTEIAGEKFYGVASQKGKEQADKQKIAQQQDPSVTTGVQWAAVAAQQQVQASQNSPQNTIGTKPAADKPANAPQTSYEILNPSMDDVAVLSTAVSMKDESVEAPRPNLVMRFLAGNIDMNSLTESYKETFKKSKSHNLLLERFMSNIKFSGLKTLLSMMGMSGEEQARLQHEVKGKALAEIDSKLSNDWAYTKAMLEITSGA